MGAGQPDAEIEHKDFVKAANVSSETVYDALTALENMQMIRTGKSPRGRTTYAVAESYIREVESAGRRKIPGRCPECKAVGLFESRFVPTPHAALRKLGACVDLATFKVVMVAIRYTLGWCSRDRCIEVRPHELQINDFERLTGLEERQIRNGLARAIELKLIGREQRPGRASVIWANPERLGTQERRPPRHVTQPERGAVEKAKQENSKTGENIGKPEHTPAIESHSYFYGQCPACRHFVHAEPVSEDELPPVEPKKAHKPPGRAGPEQKTYTTGEEKRERSRNLVAKLAGVFDAARKRTG